MDDEGGEFLVEMGRYADFEPRLIPVVVALDDLADGVQPGDDGGGLVRHGKFHEFAHWPHLVIQFLQQNGESVAGFGGNPDGVGMLFKEFVAVDVDIPIAIPGTVAVQIEAVDFVKDHEGRFARRADFVQNGVHRLDLFTGLRMTDVHDVQQQVGPHDFLERGLECLDEAVRQFADEADGVSQQHVLIGGQAQAAGGGVERGEKFVLSKHLGAGQGVEQGGFAGIRVTDDGGERPVVALAPLALGGTLAADDFQFAGNSGNAVLHAAAVGFKLRFTVTTHPDAALLAGQVAPETGQAREQMLELREFNLQLAFLRAGALRKNIKDERSAVEDLAIEDAFEVSALGG